jgi:glycine/D-amino acid oxidase-like deaminating enzyme
VSTEIIVVGAGSVGANVAYRLAQRGAKVTVLEAGAPGGGTSGASFAWLNSYKKTPRVNFELNLASMVEHANLADELGRVTGRSGWRHQGGGMHWEEDPKRQDSLRDAAERLEAWGYPIELISPEAAMQLEPDLIVEPGVREVIHTPTEGYVEMVLLIGALLEGARQFGATVRTGTPVTRVLREGDRVVGVETAAGEQIRADVVVDCAGPTTDDLLRLAGVEMPFTREPGRLIYTAPVASTLRHIVYAPEGHFRPDGGGRIVLSDEHHDHEWQEGTDWPPEKSLQAISRHFRPFAGARVEATRIGIRPIPQDRLPMVGPVPGLQGLYVVVSHSGVTLGPLWGQIAAAELLDGQQDPRLTTFRPDRFLT